MSRHSLLGELKRRNVHRAAVFYAASAWLLVQVVTQVGPVFDLPAAAQRWAITMLLIGFPFALLFSWFYEWTPQGLRLESEIDRNLAGARAGGKKLDRIIIAVLVLAVVLLLANSFMPRVARLPASGDKSIAVLPFVNMSTDAENEFFSDGLSEEILNSLARIDAMQVVGRTSSFQFKGRNEDLRVIGEQLGVAHVLEGSVRREGERARITAQLVRTSDGIHLWSQTYDRTLDDTLAVQLDIAEQVAGALDVVLDDRQRERMREAGVKNVDAFIAYQKGWKLYSEAHSKPGVDLVETLRKANTDFDKAIELEPRFSFAYFAEADFYEHILLADDRSAAERIEAQRSALHVLEQAAATSPDGQQRELALAERQLLSDDWHGLAARIDSALRQPGCSAPNWMPVFASAFGYGDLIEDLGARVTACDPLNSVNVNTRVWAARATGNAERALSVYTAAQHAKGGAPRPSFDQVIATAMLGRLVDARKLLDSLEAMHEGGYVAAVILGRAAAEDVASIRARLRSVDRKDSKLKMWAIADAVEASLLGERSEANRQAAQLDARPAGGLLLAVLVTQCQCGAPFDLDATPNFKARLAESGLRWPPPQTMHFPARVAAPAP
jgi:adenylate cyclase